MATEPTATLPAGWPNLPLDAHGEGRKLAAILEALPAERRAVIITRMFEIIWDDRSWDCDELYEWLSDDSHHAWKRN